jgi:hypothetical protein
MAVASVCQLVPTKGNLPLHLYVSWTSVLVACYSEASIVISEMLEITTLQQVSKYAMYSPASFLHFNHFLKQVDCYFWYCTFLWI